MKRAIVIVLDSVGAGALPDAAAFGDEGANTLGHIHQKIGLKVPNMRKMGLGAIPGIGMSPADGIHGSTGRAIEVSQGKDTTTGHWEMSGLRLSQAFPTYPDGFPQDVIAAFESAIGTKVIGNKPASGTAILDELGEEHLRTGYPIVYTSGDSVFQIACHKDIYPIEKLYELCRVARAQLQGRHAVGRVIARPFIGTAAGHFTRTGERRDFSLEPTGETMLDVIKAAGLSVLGVGKIEDIFALRGLTDSDHAAGNPKCIDATLNYLRQDFNGLLFVNLVDFDSTYGHRRDAQGYADALEYFDSKLPEITSLMTDEDILIITADHGCDPTFKGTDHTREYIPLLYYTKTMTGHTDLGTRATYADIAATVCEHLGLKERFGAVSFLNAVR